MSRKHKHTRTVFAEIAKFTPQDNLYRDIFFIPNARHDRPFRVTRTDRCFPTLEEAMEYRDHYEQNREAIEVEREGEIATKREERAQRKCDQAARQAVNAFYAAETQVFV